MPLRLIPSKAYLAFAVVLLAAVSGVFAYTNVSACQLIASAGEYRINTSLAGGNNYGPGINACIFIATSDVTLDCQGNTITDTAGNSFGILAATTSGTLRNVTVANCIVSGYFASSVYGAGNIFFYAVNETNIINNEVLNSNDGSGNGIGIVVYYSDKGNITGNRIYNNANGLVVSDAGIRTITNYNISGNEIYNNIKNAQLAVINDSYFTGNMIYGSINTGSSALALERVNSTLLWNNSIYNNAGHGLAMANARGVNASNNNISSNGEKGITLQSVLASVFSNNAVAFNGDNGVELNSITSSNFTGNNVSSHNHPIWGFASAFTMYGGSTGNIFAYNRLYNNSGIGFDAQAGSNSNYIYFNDITYCSNGNSIQLIDSNNVQIVGNNISSGNNQWNFSRGIHIDNSNYTLVENNTIGNNTGDGLYVKRSRYSSITNNTISGSGGQGVMLDEGSIYSEILQNSISGGNSNIVLMNGSGHNTISGNYLYNSLSSAIYSHLSWSPGPDDLPTPNITIRNNTIIMPSVNAISLAYSNDSTIEDNNLSYGIGVYSAGIFLDESSGCRLNNNTISFFPVSAVLFNGLSTQNNVSNSVFQSIAYGQPWAHAVQFTNTTATSFPDANAFYNVTIYNSSKYVAFSWDFAGYRPQNFTNFTLCNSSLPTTCITLSFAEVTNAFLGYGNGQDNLFIGSDFISVDSANWGAEQFDVPADVALRVSGCSNPEDFRIYRSPVSLPLSREDVISTGIEFTPGFKECISGDILQFNVSAFSGYAAENMYENSFSEKISMPGLTVLTRDYSQGNATTAAIGITSSNVVLDLNGYTVENGTVGIYVAPGLTNVTIMNGTVRNVTTAIIVNTSNQTQVRGMTLYSCSTGIYLDPSYNNTIINNTIFNNTDYGILMEDSHNNTIANNTIFNITIAGISTANGSNNTFFNNTIFNSTAGISSIGNTQDRLILNDIYGIANKHISIENSTYVQVMQNYVHNSSSSSGIIAIGTSYSEFSGNLLYGIQSGTCLGITQNSDHNVVYGNNFTACDTGLVSEGNINNLTTYNNTISLCQRAILLIDTAGSSISNSTIIDTPIGFELNTSSSSNLTGNRVVNSTYGFYVHSNTTEILVKDTEVLDTHTALALLNITQQIAIDNLTGTGNNRSIYAEGASQLEISNSRFTQHFATTSDRVFDPLAAIRITNSTDILIENSSFYLNNISSMLFWNTSGINIVRVNITYSNASAAAFGDTGHIYLYPNTHYVNISYLNCSNGGIESGGACFHHHGNVSNVLIDNSVFYNMSSGVSGRVPPTDNYGGYFVGYSAQFGVVNSSFEGLLSAMMIHAHNSFAYDNNITGNLRGTGIRFSFHTMRNNNYTGNVESFGLTYDDGEQMYGHAIHNYFEHDIDTSNTIDGKPIYYYCAWAGNDKHNYVETNLDGGYYACIDCSNTVFENISVAGTTQAIYIGFSDNVTVRNVSGDTLQGIKFFATTNSSAYNNTLRRIFALDPYIPFLPPDYVSSMRAANIIWSNGINVSDTISSQNFQCLLVSTSNNSYISGLSCIDSVVVPSIMVASGSSGNVFENITMHNLTGRYPVVMFQMMGLPESVISTILSSYNNTWRQVNISQANLTGRTYFTSLHNSFATVEDSWFNHTHLSFDGNDVSIANATTPPTSPPSGTSLPLASPPLFLEIQNTSTGSTINLTFYYADSTVPPGYHETAFRIWKYSNAAGVWARATPMASQEVNITANTITAYGITDFSSPFGPLAETLTCVDFYDDSTWLGRLFNVSGGGRGIELEIIAPITLCTGTYHMPATEGALIYLNNASLDCNGSTLVGARNGTAIFTGTGTSPGIMENMVIRNCTLTNYTVGFQMDGEGRNITIEDNVFTGLAGSGKQPCAINFGEEAPPADNKYAFVYITNNTFENFSSTLDDGETMAAILFGDSMNTSHSIVIANNTIRNFTLEIPASGTTNLAGIMMISGPSPLNMWDVNIANNTIVNLQSTADSSSGTFVGGIVDFSMTNSSIDNNRVYNLTGGAQSIGISAIQSTLNNYTNNIAYNASAGIGLQYSSYLNIVNNTATSNTMVGGYAVSSPYLQWENGTFSNNLLAGIYLTDGSDNNNITGCVLDNNYDPSGPGMSAGINVYNSSNTTIFNVTASGNAFGMRFNTAETAYGMSITNSTAQENSMIDFFYEPYAPWQCHTITVHNLNGSGGRWVNYTNNSANWQNMASSEIYACDADWSNFTNVTVAGSDMLQNNLFYSLFSDNIQISSSDSSGNLHGFIVSGSASTNATGIKLFNSTARSNLQAGFTLSKVNDTSAINCTASNNSGEGFLVSDDNGPSFNLLLANNTAYDNTGAGMALTGLSEVVIQNDHYYGNTGSQAADFLINASVLPTTLNMSNVIVDGPAGGYQNFTNVSINAVLSVGDSFIIRWSEGPTARPSGKVSFSNKYLNISPASGSPALGMLQLSWTDAELPGHAESNFELWKHNSSGWVMLNNTPNTTLNTLTIYGHEISSEYAILEDINCPVLSAPGNYVLAANMSGAPNNVGFLGGDTCIWVSSPDVSLDCNGYSITNNGTAGTTFGIAVGSGIRNVTITNCNIYNYSGGIATSALNDSIIRENYVHNSTNTSIYVVDGCTNITLEGNVVNISESGIEITRGAANVTIRNNTVLNTSKWGIAVRANATNTMLRDNIVNGSLQCYNMGENTTNTTYIENSASDCSSAGYILSNSVNYTFINNSAYGAIPTAFFIWENASIGLFDGNNCTGTGTCFEAGFGTYLNTIANSTIRNCNNGIRISNGAHSNIVLNNTILNSSSSAITLYSVLGNITVMGNLIDNAALNGINLENSPYNIISENLITNSGDTGISISNSSYNNFSLNGIHNASIAGISLQDASTGNRFSDDIVQESGQYDMDIINLDSPDYLICNTLVHNMTGSGGRDITFINSSVNIGNASYSELILCGANDANVTNVTIIGSDTLQNNGLVVMFSNGTAIGSTNSSGNFVGTFIQETYNSRFTNNTNEHNVYGIAIVKSSGNELDQQKAYGNAVGAYILGDSDWNNVTGSQLYNLNATLPYSSQLIFAPQGSASPEHNRITNTTIYTSTSYLQYFSVMPNANNFTNLTLCTDNSGAGCISWGFANVTYAALVNGTTILLDREFVSLNDSDAGTEQLNRSANITISVGACADGNGVGLLRAEGFPQSKAAIEAVGSEYAVSSQSCPTPETLRAEVTSFSGYTESPPYNISVLINGASTNAFYNSGEPYNLTVRVRYANGTAVPGAGVRLYEDNGYLPFVLPQYTDSNVSNYVYAKATARPDGSISLTVVPTGAAEVLSQNVGEYNVTVRAYSGTILKGVLPLTVTRRNLPYPNSTAVIVPNRGNVGYFNDDVYRIYSRTKEWLQLGGAGGGEKYSITVYTNGTVLNNTVPLISGKPYGINVTVLDSATLSPIQNASVQIIEQNGLPPLALPQYTDSNVSNIGVGYTNTSAAGAALITFIPTGNPNLEPNPLPESYNVSLQVHVNGTMIADVPLNVTSRSLSYTPSGTTQPVYNQGNIGAFNDKVYVIYTRILQWLQNQ